MDCQEYVFSFFVDRERGDRKGKKRGEIGTCDTKILQFRFQYEFEKTEIKILNLSLKSLKVTKPALFIIKINEIGQNVLFQIIYYHGILFMTTKCCKGK